MLNVFSDREWPQVYPPLPLIPILPVPLLMRMVFVWGEKSLRARAVKRIAGIVDADASIMNREAVRQSVTSSFLDEAVSVRQVRDVLRRIRD